MLPAASAGTLTLLAGGQRLLALTHSSTGKHGDRLRLFEDMLEPALESGMHVQVSANHQYVVGM